MHSFKCTAFLKTVLDFATPCRHCGDNKKLFSETKSLRDFKITKKGILMF